MQNGFGCIWFLQVFCKSFFYFSIWFVSLELHRHNLALHSIHTAQKHGCLAYLRSISNWLVLLNHPVPTTKILAWCACNLFIRTQERLCKVARLQKCLQTQRGKRHQFEYSRWLARRTHALQTINSIPKDFFCFQSILSFSSRLFRFLRFSRRFGRSIIQKPTNKYFIFSIYMWWFASGICAARLLNTQTLFFPHHFFCMAVRLCSMQCWCTRARTRRLHRDRKKILFVRL